MNDYYIPAPRVFGSLSIHYVHYAGKLIVKMSGQAENDHESQVQQ